MNKIFSFFFLLVLAIAGCNGVDRQESSERDTLQVPGADRRLEFQGRVETLSDGTMRLFWPGTSVTLRFRGEEVAVLLDDEEGENDYNVIVDGDEPRLLRMDSVERWYRLAEELPAGEHRITLFKRSEWTRGHTDLLAFRIVGEKPQVLLPPSSSGRKIEFYGNSITAGYAIHDTVGDAPDSTLTDNYPTYAALTARHFDAEYSCIARSGIGFMISWFPMIMPEMYDRLDPSDPSSKWDFSRWQPDVVVINLGQNDSWLVQRPEHPEFRHRFGETPPTEGEIVEAYKNFVKKIRSVYPEAILICALGSMDATREGSPWPGYVREAVREMNDPDILTLFFPYIGKGGHPKVEDHRVMADTLIRFIDEHVKW